MAEQALLIVDVQNDFCPGGALAVRKGDLVVPAINNYIEQFVDRSLPAYALRDWHPVDTRHFKGRGGPWPPHCVQDTPGARFYSGLMLPGTTTVLTKGTTTEDHGYSAFDEMIRAGARTATLATIDTEIGE